MKEYIELGGAPYGEECAQVGAPDYWDRANKECRTYIRQLFRLLNDNGYPEDTLPEGFNLVVKSHSHDYGTYYEVACRFNGECERSCDIATWLENNSPEKWDEVSLRELGFLPTWES